MNGRGSFISHTDKEYTWLINNSYKYGFILRYPKGKENITGYMYEEWHFRYLGLDVAKKSMIQISPMTNILLKTIKNS